MLTRREREESEQEREEGGESDKFLAYFCTRLFTQLSLDHSISRVSLSFITRV